MFDDLDATLAELIRRELPSAIAEQVSISFATPSGDLLKSVQPPAVDLFLYEIVENRDLRDRRPIEARVDAPSTGAVALRAAAPVRVDCHYLVTAWAKDPESETGAQVEHRLLGYTLRALLRHREIPEAMLQGTLKGQPLPVRAAAIQVDPTKHRSELWHALGGKPRASFDYRVTMAMPLGEIEDLGPVVWKASVDEPTSVTP